MSLTTLALWLAVFWAVVTMVEGDGMKQLPYLSEHMNREIFEHSLTASWEDTIYLEPRYAQLIERSGALFTQPVRWRPSQTAKAVYYLLHEFGHTLQNVYRGPASERDANRYAAREYKLWCKKLGYSTHQTERLWRSLPSHYRKVA